MTRRLCSWRTRCTRCADCTAALHRVVNAALRRIDWCCGACARVLCCTWRGLARRLLSRCRRAAAAAAATLAGEHLPRRAAVCERAQGHEADGRALCERRGAAVLPHRLQGATARPAAGQQQAGVCIRLAACSVRCTTHARRSLARGPAARSRSVARTRACSQGTGGECGLRGGYVEFTNIHPKTLEELYKVVSINLSPNGVGQVRCWCLQRTRWCSCCAGAAALCRGGAAVQRRPRARCLLPAC